MLKSISRAIVAALVLAAVCGCDEAQASVRVFFDHEEFVTATGATPATNPYPAGTTGPFTSNQVTFSRAGGSGGLVIADWTPLLPGNEIAVSGVENLDLAFAVPYFHAVGMFMVEPTAPGSGGCNASACIDSTFEFIVLGVPSGETPNTPRVLHTVQVNLPDDEAAFVGFASDQLITGIRVREIVGGDENEYFGAVLANGRRPGSIPASHTPRVEVFTTPLEGVVPFDGVFDFDRMPPIGQGSYRAAHLDGVDLVSAGGQFVLHTAPALGGKVARVPVNTDSWRIALPPGTYAVELPLWESSIPGTGGVTCFAAECQTTGYLLRIYNGSEEIRRLRLDVFDDRFERIRLWSTVAIDHIRFDEVGSTLDDEFLGDIRFGFTPLPPGYPQREVSTGERLLGLAVALDGDRALATHLDGVLAWQRVNDRWQRNGNIATPQTAVAIDLDRTHAVVATTGTLRVFRMLGDSAASWPEVANFVLPERPTAVRIDGDVIAVGYPGRQEVGLFRRQSGGSWAAVPPLQANPPIVGVLGFGSGIDLAGDLLAVSADRNAYHLFRLAGSSAQELFRNDVLDAIGIPGIAVGPSRMVKARFVGPLRDHAPDAGGQWQGLGSIDAPLPFAVNGYFGTGLRTSGTVVAALGQFTITGTDPFVGALRLWDRGESGWAPIAALPDPFLSPTLAAGFGADGNAVDIDGDDFVIGHTRPPYCSDAFGDQLGEGMMTCAAQTGMLHFGNVSGLTRVFADGFEPR